MPFGPPMGTLWRDLRFGLRTLSRDPGFAVVAVLMLALGIGANTAIFGLVNAFLLRLLPVKNPEQLVFVNRVQPNGGTVSDFPFTTFEQLRDHNHSFAGIFAWDDSNVIVAADGWSEMVPADFVSGSYFDVLGVRASLGRTFTLEDDKPGNKPVAVISHRYWERRFAREPAALGKTIYLGGIAFTVIGVTPREFFGRNVAGRSADVVLPMFMHAQLALKDHDTFAMMARLKPGITQEQARADVDLTYHQVLLQAAGTNPSARVEQEIHAQRIALMPGLQGASGLREEYGTKLNILMAVVGIALLIASVNIANMLLARGASRQKEIAVRLAIGAGRGQVIRQWLTEALLLSTLGGAAGLLVAQWGTGVVTTVLSYGRTPAAFELKPDLQILAFTFGVSMLTGVLFGLAPALRAARVDLNPILKGAEAGTDSRPLHSGILHSLVVSQVALSLVLLIGAGLLVSSLRRLHHIDTGFNRDKVLVGWIFPALAQYDHAKEMNLYRDLQEKLNAIPGVRSASLSRFRLMFARPDRALWVEGSAPVSDGDREIYCYPVGPRFFETQDIRLLLGRDVSSADAETGPKVAVISESVARKFFPGENPIGRHIGFDKAEAGGDIQIVGVAKDIQPRLAELQPLQAVYIPYTQAPLDWLGQMTFVLRTAVDPNSITAAVRRQVQSIAKDLPPVDVQTQAADVDEKLGDERSLATLLTFFGALALLLAAIGLYGTLSFAVARRTKELAIRMALGARKEDMLWMVLRETVSLVGIGIALGVPLSFAGTRWIASLVVGVKSADPITISLACAAMMTVALVAAYLPARRAISVDPIAALRKE